VSSLLSPTSVVFVTVLIPVVFWRKYWPLFYWEH